MLVLVHLGNEPTEFVHFVFHNLPPTIRHHLEVESLRQVPVPLLGVSELHPDPGIPNTVVKFVLRSLFQLLGRWFRIAEVVRSCPGSEKIFADVQGCRRCKEI